MDTINNLHNRKVCYHYHINMDFLGNCFVQSLSCVRLFVTPWTEALQASLSFTTARSSLNSCPLGRRCHAAIPPSVVPFSSCPQSFPAPGTLPVGLLFSSGGQRTGAAASASDLSFDYMGLCQQSDVSAFYMRSRFLTASLENSTDCIVHAIAKTQTRLSNFHFSQSFFS